MKKLVAFLSSLAMVIGMSGALPLAAHAATVPISNIQSGDLIRGTTLSAVYFMGKDGFRYVFPTDTIYFSWYSNFNDVKWVSDADLTTVQIGGNVTYKPGSTMIKINTDPRTYAVDQGGTIRWVKTEAAAIALYGSDWNKKIKDVADGFFSNYTAGADIEQASDFNVTEVMADVSDINEDKGLKAPTYITITDNAYSTPTITITAGTAVKFVNNGNSNHTATADDLNWGTGTLMKGQGFTKYFKTPGTYTYFCSYHPEMKGVIIVQ